MSSPLEELIASDGMVVKGSNGQPRLNAAVTEVRQARLALGRLIAQLSLPDEDGRALTESGKRAKHAADARWNRQRAIRERRHGSA